MPPASVLTAEDPEHGKMKWAAQVHTRMMWPTQRELRASWYFIYITQKVFFSGSERLRFSIYFSWLTKLLSLSWIHKENSARSLFLSVSSHPAWRKPGLMRLPRLLFSGLTTLRKNRKKSTLRTDKWNKTHFLIYSVNQNAKRTSNAILKLRKNVTWNQC